VIINKKGEYEPARREEMRKKQLISVILIVVMIFVCGNSLAAQSSGDKTIKGEISFITGLYTRHEGAFSGMIIAGIRTSNVISLEASIVILGSFDTVYSANLGLNIPAGKRVIPFATVGVGMCKDGLLYVNLGGGIKIGLADDFGIRVESRGWITEEAGLFTVLGGISFSF
jgi:hypothetical protein